VQYLDVPHHRENNAKISLQIKLFETTNEVEIHYLSAPVVEGYTFSSGIQLNSTVGFEYLFSSDESIEPRTAVRCHRPSCTHALNVNTSTHCCKFPVIRRASLHTQRHIIVLLLALEILASSLVTTHYRYTHSLPSLIHIHRCTLHLLLSLHIHYTHFSIHAHSYH
jgi:hypothetical protein